MMDGGQTPVAIAYDETIETHGIHVPYVPAAISPRMKDVMERDRYEAGEAWMAKTLIQPDDIVLELGAGVGLISTLAAQITAPENITVVEANPSLIPVIRETHRLNGADGVTVHMGLAVANPDADEPSQDFYVRSNFWASSLTPPHENEQVEVVEVPKIALNPIVAKQRPTVLFMDIEGAELELLRDLDMSSLRHLVVEVHPRIYALEGTAEIFDVMQAQGFSYDPKKSRGGTVVVFSRVADAKPSGPRITAITCMKDEGPFIVEWIAYHRMIGVTDFVIFTNDCSDTTVPLLDRLDKMGVVRHLENPSTIGQGIRHQPTAIAYAANMKEVRKADWVISMDVDEFINIHVGDGTIPALFAALPDADAISLAHLDFGNGGQETYNDGLIVEQMQQAQIKTPETRERRGIKTLVNRKAPPHRLSNHRPVFQDPDAKWPRWYDGAGRHYGPKLVKSDVKGLDARGIYELAQINHYPVKSNETYLVKSAKGDVVALDWNAGIDYWRKRNHNAAPETTIQARVPQLREAIAVLLRDPELARLQRDAVKEHRRLIAQARESDAGRQLLSEIETT